MPMGVERKFTNQLIENTLKKLFTTLFFVSKSVLNFITFGNYTFFMRCFLFLLIFSGLGFQLKAQVPFAQFSASLPTIGNSISVCQGEEIIFFNNSNSLSANATFLWNFGSGGNPSSSLQASNVSVFFNQVGAFTVSLQVNNNNGQPVSIASLQVNVLNLPSGNMTLGAQGNGFSTSTFNGVTVFKNCASFDSTLFSFNLTSTSNSQLYIDWGDGQISNLSGATTVQHLYGIGQFNLFYTITSANGCTRTYSYIVFNGSSPVITVSGSGQNTCVPFPYPIDIIANDVPISYYVSYSDDTPPLNFTTDNDTTLSHIFNTSSCGEEYYFSSLLPPIPNAYSATIVAQNLCSANGFPTVITIGPITISQGVEPLIDMDPISPVCLTETVTFSNASISGLNITSDGCDSSYSFYWQMQETSGFVLSSGDLGNDNGFGGNNFDPMQWQNGSNDIAFDFQTAGVYHLKLFVGSPCGLDSVIKTFEIKPLSSVQVNMLEQTICSGDTISTIIFTSVVPDYNIYWEVSSVQDVEGIPNHQGFGGSPLTISDWILSNNSSSTGYLDISASVGCSEVSPTVHRVYVNPQGNVFVNPSTQEICNDETIEISISSNLTDATFEWTADYNNVSIQGPSDGSGEQIVQTIHNSSLNFDSVYYHVVISNSSCPGQNDSALVVIQPDIYINPISSLIYCPDVTADPISFDSNIDNASYSWTNSNTSIGLPGNGNGNIDSWNTANPGESLNIAQIEVVGQANNCPGVSILVDVQIYPTPNFDYVLIPESGLGCVDPVSINGSTNTPNPLWSWSGGTIVNGPNSSSPLVNEASTYNLTITDAISNCSANFSVQIDTPTEVNMQIIQQNDVSCFGLTDGIIQIAGSGETLQYVWTPNVSSTDLANDLSAQSYSVQVTNEDGCTDDEFISLIQPNPLEIVLIDSVTSQCGEYNGSVDVSISGGSGGYNFSWSNGSNNADLFEVDQGDYVLTVVDDHSCEATFSLNISCVQFPDILPYQFISPNDDGNNDFWVLHNIDEYEDVHVFVFNRWGSVVFEDEHYQNDWKGTCNKCLNDNEPLPSATYYYKILTNKKSKPEFTGFIEIQP
jgi:gliding motility-associated-like protein